MCIVCVMLYVGVCMLCVYMCGVGGVEVYGRRCDVCTECVGVWAHEQMLRPEQDSRCLPPSFSTLLSGKIPH